MRMIFWVVVSWLCFVANADKAFLSTYVIDYESHLPVRNVGIVASFADEIGWRAWTESPRPDIVYGLTDNYGFCRLGGRTNCGKSSCWIKVVPAGYYRPQIGGGIKYERKTPLGVWLPDNLVVTLALHRVKHPIPLNVCRVRKHGMFNEGGVDATNAVMRYDFMAGDWLPPHGNGVYTDMVVRSRLSHTELVKRRIHLPPRQFFDFTHALEFPGVGNGLSSRIVSATAGIKLRVAPDTGYVPSTVIHMGERKLDIGPNTFSEPYSETNENRCYFFRIRSRFNDNGELVAAYYGKVYDDFKFDCNAKAGLCGIDFFYYLNPTSLDRNLEWDMRNNLCANPGNLGMPRP